MALTIRMAGADDIALIFSFVRELADYENLLADVDATEESLCEALLAKDPKVYCDIAEWDGKPAGFALWFYNFSTFRGRHGIYLEDLFVRPEFRRLGIARALLGKLARRCIDENLARLEWWVLEWNEPALRFYRSLGAKPMSDWIVQRVTGDALRKLAR